jgi:hypothetical protein
MLSPMGRNVIVSEDTVRDLLEAHASLSAWYYELWAALRAANATARAPDDAARAAFVERLAVEFPEVAAVARTVRNPRMYVPAPPPTRSPASLTPEPLDEPETVVERTRAGEIGLNEVGPSEVPLPPPMVDPASVKYGQ